MCIDGSDRWTGPQLFTRFRAVERVRGAHRSATRAGIRRPVGVYPNVPSVTYTVEICINNRRFDHKVQDYPPHGSVPASQVGTGDVFRLEGQAVDSAGNVGVFFLMCTVA